MWEQVNSLKWASGFQAWTSLIARVLEESLDVASLKRAAEYLDPTGSERQPEARVQLTALIHGARGCG